MMDSPIVRLIASGSSLVLVPVLLVLAVKAPRGETLPRWRNGIGLTSVLLLVLDWLWFGIGLADTALTPRLVAMYLDVTFLAVICTWLAAAFASVWIGRSRVEVLAACVLMFVGWHYFGYT